MSLLTKLLLVFVTSVLVVMVCAFIYLPGGQKVEELLRERASERASRVGRKAVRILNAQESGLVRLSRVELLVNYVRDARPDAGALPPSALGPPSVPETVRAHFEAFFGDNREYLQSVTCLDRSGSPLFRLSWKGDQVYFQTDAFTSADSRYEPKVWELREQKTLRSAVLKEGNGAAMRLTVPVGLSNQLQPVAALAAEVRLGDVLREADEAESPEEAAGARAQGQQAQRRSLVAIDNASDEVVYHTNSAYSHRNAADAMPYFAALATRMRAGQEGFDFYDGSDGDRHLAVFQQVNGLGLSLAAVENYTVSMAGMRGAALWGSFVLGVACAMLAFLFLTSERYKKSEKSDLHSGAVVDDDSKTTMTESGSPANEELDADEPVRNKIFISYSHSDKKWRDELQTYLAPLEDDNVVIWDDTSISPGQDWQAEIDKALRVTKVAVLLVSENFMASDYVRNHELPALLAAASDGLLILPVIVSPCVLGRLSKIQAINSPSKTMTDMIKRNRARVWLELVKRITATLSSER